MLATPLLAVAGLCTPAAAAQQGERPVVIDTAGVFAGDVFGCRIPAKVRYDGEPELAQFNVIAKAYSGERELASTGIASGDRALLGERMTGGTRYLQVPLQFDLAAADCGRVDGLRIVFARCVFGDRPAEDCIGRVRFAEAGPERPLILPVQ